jgi:hypothetical protein
MFHNKIGAVDKNCVNILFDLETFVMIFLSEPHARANDL